jgi:hypothetical protein
MIAIDKEVYNFYDKGLKVPDDVTLLWADDKCVLPSFAVCSLTDY